MDAMEYIEERNRMCRSQGTKCKGCPANFDSMFCCGVAAISKLDAKEQVAIVEKWSAEHPKKRRKTRQDVFLEKYPESFVGDSGVLRICPRHISAYYRDDNGDCIDTEQMCVDCRREFWMEEVTETEH